MTDITHPGEILWRDFLTPMNITCYRLAKDIGVPVNRITAIIHEERAITPETGLLLSRYFGQPDSIWCNLQAQYNMECKREKLRERLEKLPSLKL